MVSGPGGQAINIRNDAPYRYLARRECRARLGLAPLGAQQSEDDLVQELPVYPRCTTQRAFEYESGPCRRLDHRCVIGQGLKLQPMQTAHAEAVLAEHSHDIGSQAVTAKGRAQREAEVSRPVVQVDAPQERRAR